MRTSRIAALLILFATINAFGPTSVRANHERDTLKSGSPVSEGYFKGADGVRLFYRKVGRGPQTVVFLHGGPGSNFRGSGDYMEALAIGRTLIMYDQRGSGRSEVVTNPKLLTAAHHVRDLEALRHHFGIRRMTLIGLSWGSGLASMYAAERPERVERLLLVSPMSPTKALFVQRGAKINSLLSDATVSRRNAIREMIPRANDVETLALCRELSDITFRPYLMNPTSQSLAHAAQRCDIPPAAIRNRLIVEAATVASLGEWNFLPLLARLRMPALVMEGTETKVPVDATRAWASAMPNARLYLIPQAGHEFFVDQPTSFVKVAEQFLRGQFPDASPEASDREQITAILRHWEEAWNSHDMHALANLFHDDGVWILWTGGVWKGRNTIEEGLAAVHKTVYRNSIQREHLEELSFVGPDAAVLRFFSTLTGDERFPDKTIRSRKVLIVTKRQGIWKIGWGQNTRLADTTPG